MFSITCLIDWVYILHFLFTTYTVLLLCLITCLYLMTWTSSVLSKRSLSQLICIHLCCFFFFFIYCWNLLCSITSATTHIHAVDLPGVSATVVKKNGEAVFRLPVWKHTSSIYFRFSFYSSSLTNVSDMLVVFDSLGCPPLRVLFYVLRNTCLFKCVYLQHHYFV